jgi:phytoene dehydrogenase-like protein
MKEVKTHNSGISTIYDIIVIGAGPGGSAIGALLAKRGYKVLIVDKNPRAGGRMMTIHKDGFHYELFPINGVPQKNSHFERILKEIGKEDEVEVLYLQKNLIFLQFNPVSAAFITFGEQFCEPFGFKLRV